MMSNDNICYRIVKMISLLLAQPIKIVSTLTKVMNMKMMMIVSMRFLETET